MKKKTTVTKVPAKTTRKASPASDTGKNPQSFLKNTKRTRLIALIVIIIALGFVFRSFFIAAIVNGKPISRYSVIKELERQGGKATLDSLITKQLVLQDADKRNISVSDDEINSEMKKISESLTSQGITLDEALSSQGITQSQLESDLRTQILVQKATQDSVKVTDKEIADFMEKNKDLFPDELSEEEKRQQAAEEIKLVTQQEEIQKYIENLRKDAQIINLVNY